MRTMFRPVLLAGALAIAGALMTTTSLMAQEKVLRIGMTAADIPRTHGQPDQGFEGNRFTGIPMYDALVNWDLSKTDGPSVIIPGLALSWEVDATDKNKWVFKLRPGVKFHDGSPFNAAAVVWNVQKVLDQNAAHFDQSQVGVTVSRMPNLLSARAIDDLTVELTTRNPDSFLPINLTNLFMASPTHWQKLLGEVPASVTDPKARAAAAWTAFAGNPSGTGPFRGVRLVPRERFEMVANKEYWDTARRPKVDRVVLLPLPEANARTAALLSGQVDWIEAPAPDAVAQITARGFKMYTNAQPHVWPWQFSFREGSPFVDRRVRHAANLCINRDELKSLLSGLMEVPRGTYPPGHPWWGNPTFEIKYDLATARRLMTEAGYSAQRPVNVKVLTSASGSGQMQPIVMNEWLQQALKECFFNVELEVAEWNAVFNNWREGAGSPGSRGANATNVTFSAMDPFFGMMRFVTRQANPPASNNWGFFNVDEFDQLAATARSTFDDAGRDRALAALHKRIVEEAPFLWVAHDVGPRAMSARVTGVIQPRSWFIDITTMDIRPGS
ncbi:ABC transporter substrate-binding protein [Phreatobacter oligotrophus]|jgi:peptide/nickel transport system substrate-binding protein|uniref:ABC-type transport system substrate-binding protein n=1 Tax=Phreatobacter oligotrophus TaxID=1122261 RepID=A0A2T4Z0U8_9HYPH|nr:ABC-type transport system substrate-binding protein [Phreatobacter oligotrophus]